MSEYYNVKEDKHIQSALDVFNHTTGITCSLIDLQGNVIYQVGVSATYCKEVEHLISEEAICKNAHIYASQQAKTLGEAYVSYCPAGLIHYTVALEVGDVFTGAIIAGPIHMSEPDLYEVEQLMLKYLIPLKEKKALENHYNAVPLISTGTARYQLELLTILARDIMIDTKTELNKKKAFFVEQRQISESIQELKELEPLMSSQGQGYPIHLEGNLKSAIIKGDEASAKAILNELLGYVFFKHQGNNRKLIAMSMELVVIMSRAAVEGGARYDDVAKATQDMYFIALESDDIESICNWLLDILETIILFVFPLGNENKEQTSVIRKAIIYMNRNLQSNVTLEDVAKVVNLSTTYFSRLFSNEMHMTYVEYLAKIRIEESKKYLVDLNYSLSDVAARLGFSDQSYYSKVFKKVEGITPGKYRKMFI